jgi:ACS family allantoate permease-like MFS transporter
MSDAMEKDKIAQATNTASLSEGIVNDYDKAYQFAKDHHTGPLSDEENRRILRKVDRHLLPLVSKPLASIAASNDQN